MKHQIMLSISRVLLWVYLSAFFSITPLFGQSVWLRRNVPIWGPVINVVCTPSGDIFADVGDRGVYRSTDDGASWIQLALGYNQGTGYQDFISDNTGVLYVGGDNGWRLWYSTDKGSNWGIMNDETHFHEIAVDVGYRMYAATLEGILWSDDSGRTMHQTTTSKVQSTAKIHVSTSGDVFIAETEHLYRSTDRGISWEDLYPNLPKNFALRAVCSDPSGVLYANIHHYDPIPSKEFWRVVRSTDNGETWMEPIEHAYLSMALAAPAPGTVLLMTQQFMIKSTDYGDTWQDYYEGMTGPDYHYDLAFMPDGRAVVGSSGCIYITSKPVGVESVAEVPSSLSLAQSYPNPVSSGQDAVVTFGLERSGNVSVSLYSILGVEVRSATLGQKSSGRHEYTLPTRGLAPGVYQIVIRGAGDVKTGRVVVR